MLDHHLTTISHLACGAGQIADLTPARAPSPHTERDEVVTSVRPLANIAPNQFSYEVVHMGQSRFPYGRLTTPIVSVFALSAPGLLAESLGSIFIFLL